MDGADGVAQLCGEMAATGGRSGERIGRGGRVNRDWRGGGHVVALGLREDARLGRESPILYPAYRGA